MKTNKTIIIFIVILIIVAICLHFKNKKQPSFMTTYFPFLGSKSTTEKAVLKTSPENTDITFLKSLGLSEDYLSMLSQKDKSIVRDYVENYTRKGVRVTKDSQLHKDLLRINSYSNMFLDGIQTT